MSEREKGTATLACPNCGTELAAEQQPDGSLAASTCTNCGGGATVEQPTPEQAAEQPAEPTRRRREAGTDTAQEPTDG